MNRLFILLSSYAKLPPELIDFLKEKLRSKTLKKKKFLLREGEIDRYIYFIERGITRTYATTEKGDFTTWIQQEGEIVISVDSFFDQVPSAEWIVAGEKLTVLYISYDELEEACRKWPEFGIVRDKIKSEYYSRQTKWERWIRSTPDPKERYLQFINEQAALAKRISKTVLSSYLYMDYSTLKRIIKALRDKG